MTDWAVLGHDGHAARAFVLRGSPVTHSLTAPDSATLLARVNPALRILYRIGEGQTGSIPTKILPQVGHGLAGFVQDSPPDVIDGWVRFLLIGLLSVRSSWDGVAWVVLRDLHHWLHLSAGEAVSSQSFLTPRLITTLGGASSFCETAISDTLTRPERLAAQLRSAQVTHSTSAVSGHLLGAELAAARPYWLGQSVSLIADSACATQYSHALSELGVPVTVFDSEALIAPALAALATALGYGDLPAR
ncbi:hypothetical protein ACSSVY_003894 [Roseovarius sp. MBR-51]